MTKARFPVFLSFSVFLSFPAIEETKVLKNCGKLNNAQFPHEKIITIKWGNQLVDEFPHSGDSGIRDISYNPLICQNSVQPW